MPLSWAACIQLRAQFGSELQVGPELTMWSHAEFQRRVQPALVAREKQETDVVPYADMFPSQRVGIEFIHIARRALIGDQMGTGKTAMAIRAAKFIADSFPMLVICPNSMKYVWEEEFARWYPEARVVVITGGAVGRRKLIAQVERGEADVAVINWEALRLHTRLAHYGPIELSDDEKKPKELNEIDWGFVVADEAHRAIHPNAKQTRAWWYLSHRAKTASVAMTGTPISKDVGDLFGVMRGIAPREYPSKVLFIERYALQAWNNFGGQTIVGIRPEMKDEFYRILDPRFIRRPKEAVLPFLPPKMPPTYRYVDLVPKQRKAYDQMRDQLLTELESGMLMASNPLTRMTRLVQFAAAYGVVDDANNLLLAEPSATLDALDDVVEEAEDEQLVVFAESRQLIELLAKRLDKKRTPYGLVIGTVSPEQRQENVRRFQEGHLKIIGVTLGAGGEGLTLTAASTVVFLQRSFSAIKNTQAEDRLHRPGQTRPVNVIDIIPRDTVVSKIHEQFGEKLERLQEIARDEDTIKRWLTK